MNLEDLFQRIKTFSQRHLGKGASSEEINKAQQELSVNLPLSYISFLRELGWCSVEDLEIFGLGSDVPHHLNLMDLTYSERTEAGTKLPSFLIPIMNDGMGNLYCLDTQQIKEGDCPVVFWNHEYTDNQIPEEVGINFSTWLSNILDEL